MVWNVQKCKENISLWGDQIGVIFLMCKFSDVTTDDYLISVFHLVTVYLCPVCCEDEREEGDENWNTNPHLLSLSLCYTDTARLISPKNLIEGEKLEKIIVIVL